MENKLLQSLLQAGLLDIGDSDERLENIEKSIADVEKLLKNDLTLLPSYTLVSLDPDIGPKEPVLQQVEAIIAVHWKALRAKFSETPVQIIRAVIINALYNIGIADARIARIVYLTAINLYPFIKLKREKEVIERLITELGEISEKDAVSEWALDEEEPKLKIPALKITGLQFGKVDIDGAQLKDGIHTALKNTTQGYGPQHGADSEWGRQFSKGSSESIVKAMQDGLNQLTGGISTDSLESSINKFFTEFKKALDPVLKSSFNSLQAIERRSKLLWWKETLYSSSLKDSYRTVNEIQQAVIMSKDLYNQLPSRVPVSVDYLLRDTLLLLNNKAGKKAKFSEYLNDLAKAENQDVLKDHLSSIEFSEKRISITDFIGLLIHGKVEASSLKQYTGIDDTSQVSLLDISVMILHDLMADYLTTHQ